MNPNTTIIDGERAWVEVSCTVVKEAQHTLYEMCQTDGCQLAEGSLNCAEFFMLAGSLIILISAVWFSEAFSIMCARSVCYSCRGNLDGKRLQIHVPALTRREKCELYTCMTFSHTSHVGKKGSLTQANVRCDNNNKTLIFALLCSLLVAYFRE